MKAPMRNITTTILNKLGRRKAHFATERGYPGPLGATITSTGVNFCVFSDSATLSLALIRPGENEPFWEMRLDPIYNKTGHIWHIHVCGLSLNVHYGYRVESAPEILLDPYAKAISGGEWGQLSFEESRQARHYAVLVVPAEPGEPILPTPLADSIIYELHVRGFTRHISSDVVYPGTFNALAEKAQYLKNLGITAVELMPVAEFDENDNRNRNPATGAPLKNFWGYNTIGFFAAKASYAAEAQGQIAEFKEMVRSFHRAGIEVILDMVFNHTGEGNLEGVPRHFRKFGNGVYYMLDTRGDYLNFSGCGNSMNCNHPLVGDFILDCLRYWAVEMNVDGFRFDLASIFTRGENGRPLFDPPVVERIAKDPVLAGKKLIAEAWDAGGLYQVGNFPAYKRWADWNGKFRDDVRAFLRGDPGQTLPVAMRIAGSPDLYTGRFPYHSVNFVTCHDGFTLYDLVSYSYKHNAANGEQNRDGSDENFSCNSGIEGETDDPEILRLRYRQMKNFLAMLFLSQGVPMLLAGDEFARTQKGNNNAYSQDNEISWVDWGLLKVNASLVDFTRKMIAFRKRHPVLRQKEFLCTPSLESRIVSWHGVKIGKPDWGFHSHSIALLLAGSALPERDSDIYVAANAYWQPLTFEVPTAPSQKPWHVFLDTARLHPYDIVPEDMPGEFLQHKLYKILPRSLIVLVTRDVPTIL